MSRSSYEFAELKPEVVEEIRIAERKISEISGQPITLIAYRSDAESAGSDTPTDAAQ